MNHGQQRVVNRCQLHLLFGRRLDPGPANRHGDGPGPGDRCRCGRGRSGSYPQAMGAATGGPARATRPAPRSRTRSLPAGPPLRQNRHAPLRSDPRGRRSGTRRGWSHWVPRRRPWPSRRAGGSGSPWIQAFSGSAGYDDYVESVTSTLDGQAHLYGPYMGASALALYNAMSNV